MVCLNTLFCQDNIIDKIIYNDKILLTHILCMLPPLAQQLPMHCTHPNDMIPLPICSNISLKTHTSMFSKNGSHIRLHYNFR